MTSRNTAIDHPVRRLLIALPEPYDTAQEHYENLVELLDGEVPPQLRIDTSNEDRRK